MFIYQGLVWLFTIIVSPDTAHILSALTLIALFAGVITVQCLVYSYNPLPSDDVVILATRAVNTQMQMTGQVNTQVQELTNTIAATKVTTGDMQCAVKATVVEASKISEQITQKVLNTTVKAGALDKQSVLIPATGRTTSIARAVKTASAAKQHTMKVPVAEAVEGQTNLTQKVVGVAHKKTATRLESLNAETASMKACSLKTADSHAAVTLPTKPRFAGAVKGLPKATIPETQTLTGTHVATGSSAKLCIVDHGVEHALQYNSEILAVCAPSSCNFGKILNMPETIAVVKEALPTTINAKIQLLRVAQKSMRIVVVKSIEKFMSFKPSNSYTIHCLPILPQTIAKLCTKKVVHLCEIIESLLG